MESPELWYGLFALIVLLFSAVSWLFIYAGLLYDVKVGAGKPPVQKITIAYKYGRGPYRNSGYVFSEASSIAPSYRSIGLYYDDPKQVPPEKLRWAVGTILSEGNDLPDQTIVDQYLGKGFHLFFLPAVSNAVRTTFPNKTSLSILLGIFKVYPRLAEYVKMNRLCAHPFMEIYDAGVIHFMAPLAKQDEFYVHEAVLQALQPDELEDQGLVVPEEEGLHVPTTRRQGSVSQESGMGASLRDSELKSTAEGDGSGTQRSTPDANINGSGDHQSASDNIPANDKTELKQGQLDVKGRSISQDSASVDSHGDDKENKNVNIMRSAVKGAVVQTALDYHQNNPTPSDSESPPHPNRQHSANIPPGDSHLNQMPPSPAMSSFSESSFMSSATEGSSVASFYTSQSDMSYTSGSRTEFSDSDMDTEKEDCALEDSRTDTDRSL